MSNEPDAPAKAVGTAPGRQVLSDALDSALESLAEGTAEGTEETPEETAGTVETPVEEPEHVKWVKSIDGDWDPKTGQIIPEKVAKRAFELNKQAQASTQKLNQLTQLVQHPEIAKIVSRLTNPDADEPETPETPDEEKTDEEVLEDWVNKRLEAKIKPIIEENRMLYNEFANTQMIQTYSKLKEEFGADDAGVPLYDSVREEVGAQIAAAAQANGIKPQELWNELIRRGQLYDTLASTARNILYPKLKERVSTLQGKSLEDKKKTRLGPKGSPATSVKANKNVNTFSEAVKAAEEEHPEFKQLA